MNSAKYHLSQLVLYLSIVREFLWQSINRSRIGIIISLGIIAVSFGRYYDVDVFWPSDLIDWFEGLGNESKEYVLTAVLSGFGWLVTYIFAESVYVSQKLSEERIQFANKIEDSLHKLRRSLHEGWAAFKVMQDILTHAQQNGFQLTKFEEEKLQDAYSVVKAGVRYLDFDWPFDDGKIHSNQITYSTVAVDRAYWKMSDVIDSLKNSIAVNGAVFDAIENKQYRELLQNESLRDGFARMAVHFGLAMRMENDYISRVKRDFTGFLMIGSWEWMKKRLDYARKNTQT